VTKPQPAATSRRAQTLAADGLQAAETNATGMERKVLSLRSPEVK